MSTLVSEVFSTLLHELARLQPALNALDRTIVPFAISALIAIWLACSLMYLEHLARLKSPTDQPSRTLLRVILLLHASPLMFGVPVTTGMLLQALDVAGLYTLKRFQSDLALAGNGLVLFTFVAYALMAHVFNLPDRLAKARRLASNMQNEPWVRRAALKTHAALPPLCLTVAILLVLQNSMYAAPTFLAQHNAMLYLSEALKHMEAPIGYRAAVAFLIAFVIATFLAASYRLGEGLCRFLLYRLSRRRTGATQLPQLLRAAMRRSLHWALLATAAFSTLAFLVITISVGAGLLHAAQTGPRLRAEFSPSVMGSLVTPGTSSAVVAALMLWIFAILYRSRRVARTQRGWLFGAGAVLAFMPPNLYGSLALPLVTEWSHPFVVWGATLSWASGIALFVAYTEVFQMPNTAVVNARLSSLRPGRFAQAVLLGPLGSLTPRFVMVVYLLWVEEGLQVALDVPGTLATFLYRGHTGEWSTPALTGMIACLSLWATVLLLSTALQPAFRALVARTYRMPRTALVAILTLLVVPADAALAQIRSTPRLIAGLEAISIELPATGGVSHVQELLIDNETVLYLEVPSTLRSLQIDRLVVRTPRPPQIRVRGAGARLDELLIKEIFFEHDTYRPLLLRLEELRCGRLEISNPGPGVGASDPGPARRVELEFDAHSAAEHVVLRSLRLSSATITLRQPGPSEGQFGRVELLGIQASRILIQGVPPDGAEAAITVTGSMMQSPLTGLPVLSLRDLTWRGGALAVMPAGDERKLVVDLARVNYVAGETAAVDLRAFPEAEVRWAQGEINGPVRISAQRLQELTLDRLKTGPDLGEARLDVAAEHFSSVGLTELNIGELVISAPKSERRDWYFTALRSVTVGDRIAIPRSFLEQAARESTEDSRVRHFIGTLQNFGEYTEDSNAVGFDAVYYRNIAELHSMHAPVAWALDWFTGLGIVLWKPVATWVGYSLLYIILAVGIVYQAQGGPVKSVKSALCAPLMALLTARHGVRVPGTARRRLTVAANVYRFVAFLQITVITLYMGETVLGI